MGKLLRFGRQPPVVPDRTDGALVVPVYRSDFSGGEHTDSEFGFEVAHPRLGPRFWPGTMETQVAGVTYHPEAFQEALLRPGQPARLERDRDNPHDRNAVRVLDAPGRRHIGFLPADIASEVAGWTEMHALVLRLWQQGERRIACRLLLAETPLALDERVRPPTQEELLGAVVASPGMTVHAWLAIWQESRENVERVKTADWKVVERIVLPALGELTLTELTPAVLKTWLQGVRAASKTSRARACVVLAQSMYQADRRGLLPPGRQRQLLRVLPREHH